MSADPLAERIAQAQREHIPFGNEPLCLSCMSEIRTPATLVFWPCEVRKLADRAAELQTTNAKLRAELADLRRATDE